MKSLTTFFSNLTLGKKVLLAFAPVLSVLVSMKAAILGLWVLILVDLITGIRKNMHQKGIKFNPLKKNFWMAIKSYLLRRTWIKTTEYGLGIIVIATLESLVIGATPISFMAKTFTITELSVVIPACVEVWSVYENLEAVSGTNILKRMSGLLPEQLRNIFKGKNE